MLDRLYFVFFQKPHKGKTERHLLGRFMTHGNNLRIIEDYHDQLANSLAEGPIDLHSLQLMDRLKQNPYIKVISQQEVDQAPEFAEFASGEKQPEAETPTPARGSIFEYHQHGAAAPQIIEFRGGVPHLNNAALSPEEIAAIKHNVTNGIGKIVHRVNSLEKSIQKMEGVFKQLMKRDDEDEPHHEDVTAAFDFLRNLVGTHPEAAKHERTLARLVFQDAMVPKVGSKYAHKDFLSRPREGIHVVLDGNDFKSINDAHGHPVGDAAIKAYGKALREAVDEAGEGKGKAFRMGGDEFAVHMPTTQHASKFGRIMREKLDAIPPIGGTHKLSMAMGFGKNLEDADKALYMAKEQKLHPETKQPLYVKGQAPTMAHSLMPGHEGPIPLSPEMPSMKVSGLNPNSKMSEPNATANATELNKAEELQKMAVSSIPQGRRLFQKTNGSQVYDYSHALTPKQQAAGYEMRVEHYPDNNLHVSIERHSRPVGFVHATFSGGTIKPIQSEIEEPFRNQGLGTQAYEALLAHGFHHGAKSVAGGPHSTSASMVHQKLAERHGTEYKATPAPKEVRKKKVGPFDSRVGEYKYALKSEADLSKAFVSQYGGKLSKTEELNKVSLTPDSVSRRMTPHQIWGSDSFDRVESYDLGNGLWHHVYYQSGDPDKYRSVFHSLSNSENPLHKGFVTSSAGLVPGNYEDHLGGFTNNPWKDAESVAIHGETTSVGPKGSGTIFYRNMAKIHGRMASDSSTSPAADGVWKKLVNDPEFHGQLGPEKGQLHWVEHKGPKPVPTKVIEGDGRPLKAQIETPVNPYRTEIHKFADKNGVGRLEAHTYHGDKQIGVQGFYMNHQNKTLHQAGPYYTSRGNLLGSHIDYDHQDTGAGGVGRKTAERETGYKYAGDLPSEMADKLMAKP